MSGERLFLVTYDISDSRRWRLIYRIMKGFGEWLQLSVFQCRLSARRREEMETRLREVVKLNDDHVLIIDIGPADRSSLAISSIGRQVDIIERKSVVI